MYRTLFPADVFKSDETPFYYYDLRLLDDTVEAAHRAAMAHPGYTVHYAVKANPEMEILKRIAAAGFGADTVSIGEINAAVAAGFPAPKIVFAGVGKTDKEIVRALQLGIGCFNVESEPELNAIEELAYSMKIQAPIALRVNPEIDAHTHHYITTGLAENKFGIPYSKLGALIRRCDHSEWINFRGLHFHIGSQITDLEPYRVLCERINSLQEKYADIRMPSINVGGGLGVDYDDPEDHPIPDFEAYFDVFAKNLKLRPGQQLHFELGRSLVAQCGSLITRVIYVKEGLEKKFVITDAGFNDLIRPALYQAHHKIENLTSKSTETEVYDVVGPICESSDVFGTDERLPLTRRGDILAIRTAGAYGQSMASTYNCRPLIAARYSR